MVEEAPDKEDGKICANLLKTETREWNFLYQKVLLNFRRNTYT